MGRGTLREGLCDAGEDVGEFEGSGGAPTADAPSKDGTLAGDGAERHAADRNAALWHPSDAGSADAAVEFCGVEVHESALEAAGVEFIPENGGGAGVRLRKTGAPPDHPKPAGPATDVVERMDAAIEAHRGKKG